MGVKISIGDLQWVIHTLMEVGKNDMNERDKEIKELTNAKDKNNALDWPL